MFFKEKLKAFLRKMLIKIAPELGQYLSTTVHDIRYPVNIYASKISKLCKVYPNYSFNNVETGDYTYIGQNAFINFAKIGKFCSIGPNFLCGWGEHPTNGISTSPMFYSTMKQNGFTLATENKFEELSFTTIGNDVFIGANVTVLNGVTIGDGAIIGAGAVVSKDIPPYAIAVGVPIRIIKYRFSAEIIERFLEIKWWDWPLDKIHQVEKNFFDIKTFLKNAR
jgi:virginiamycin A acetyltransferase